MKIIARELDENDEPLLKRKKLTPFQQQFVGVPTVELLTPDLYQLTVPIKPLVYLKEDDSIYQSPIGIFNIIFDNATDLLYDYNATRYKQHIMDRIDKCTDTSRRFEFRHLQKQDLRKYIGAVLLMDVYERPELKMYWGYDGSLDKLKPISDNIEYKLFLDIKNSIGIDNKNKLNQIVCQQAAFMIAPTVEMAVDEQLRLFTGAYVNKMKMPSKPAGEGCHA